MMERGRGAKIGIRSFLLAAMLTALYFCDPPFAKRAGQGVQDGMLRLFPADLHTPSAVVVLVDRKSVREFGVARLIRQIAGAGPRAIGYLSCEPSAPSAGLQDVVSAAGNVAAGYRCGSGAAISPGEIESSRIRYITNPWGKTRPPDAVRLAGAGCLSLPVVRAAASSGFVDIPPGTGGLVREIPLVCGMREGFYQSAVIAMLKIILDTDRVILRLRGGSVSGVEIGGLYVRTDRRGCITLRDFSGPSVRVISAVDVLSGDTGHLRGRVVIVDAAGEGK